MKGSFTVQFSGKEAIALLAAKNLPKTVTAKIVRAFQDSSVTPIGKKAAIVAGAKTKSKATINDAQASN